MPTKAQLAQAEKVIRFEIHDPLTGKRRCRWCGLDAPGAAQNGGEYLCPDDRGGCGRWQAEKAFPDGVPGLTQDRVECPSCGTVSHRHALSEGVRRCPRCGEEEVPRG